MDYQKYVNEVTHHTKVKENKEKADIIKRYMNTNYSCFGLSVVDIRDNLKSGYSFFNLKEKEILKIWNYIFKNSKHFEVLSQPLIYYQSRKKILRPSHFKIFKDWINKIDNWEHSDRMSDILSALNEGYPKQILPELQSWNNHKNPWYRRQSIVSLFYYSRLRKKYPSFDKSIKLIDNLLFDKDVYVQKGVGWALRELYNCYPQKTYKYLLKRAKEIHPVAWQASTEKLLKRDKDRLKTLRKRQ